MSRDSALFSAHDHSPEKLYEIGKTAIEKQANNLVENKTQDLTDIYFGVMTLKIAAEKFEEKKSWQAAMNAWALIEVATSDPAEKQSAKERREWCIVRVNGLFTPRSPKKPVCPRADSNGRPVP